MIEMEHPTTLAAYGAPKNDLAGRSIGSETTKSLQVFEARRLARRCAISLTLGAIIPRLLHRETVQ